MALLRYTLSRILQMIPVLLGITLVAFLLLRVLPGDPASLMIGARGSDADVLRLRHQLGLDRPLWVQYAIFLREMASGSFGQSLAYRRPVMTLIAERLAPTLWLVGLATVLAVAITFPLAVVSALRRNRLPDLVIKTVFTAALSMPQFWLGILLILLFSLRLHLFPVAGYGSGPLGHLWHLFLPAFVIALGTSALTIRSLRSSIIAVQTAEYIDTAYAKGLTGRMVMRRHILRNAAVSTISVLGVHTGWVIGGTVVIESVFAIPGLGQLLVASIAARDYAAVQGLTVVFAVMVTAISLATDLGYALVDPRVELE
ncbi:MAG TPA: ABC transporter permease [Acetobacteraceae bacterium]|jgi:peptide/nickel transport system permease protein|nr:ABC transporter permease [Acetobacteraceae bacterium]